MKLISTGGTGLIGRGALDQALAHPSVTEVVALVRRPIEDEQLKRHPKLKQVVVPGGDFLHYDEKVVEACRGAVGCVWALGNGASMKASPEEKEKVLFKFPRAFIDQVAIPNGRANGRPFRMCWVGGQIMEFDQSKSLWILAGPRKQMGREADSMLSYVAGNAPYVELRIVNCGFVHVCPTLKIRMIAAAGGGVITTTQLGRAMVTLATEGDEKKVLWNKDLVELGEKVAGQWKKA